MLPPFTGKNQRDDQERVVAALHALVDDQNPARFPWDSEACPRGGFGQGTRGDVFAGGTLRLLNC